MEPTSRRYRVDAASDAQHVTRWLPGVPQVSNPPPRQVGTATDQWSPEKLLVATAVDCFILTFRALARASSLPWERLSCTGEGVVDLVGGAPRCRSLALSARLALPAGGNVDKAKRLLKTAEGACTASLQLHPSLTSEVAVAEPKYLLPAVVDPRFHVDEGESRRGCPGR